MNLLKTNREFKLHMLNKTKNKDYVKWTISKDNSAHA